MFESAEMKPVLCVNIFLGEDDFGDRYFQIPDPAIQDNYVLKFKRWAEANLGVEVHTVDYFLAQPERVQKVIYFDYGWRYWLRDPFLRHIPREKRVLVIVEPTATNISLFAVPWFRNMFGTVLTWDERLLARHREYRPINVPVGAEPSNYRENRFPEQDFAARRLLVAINGKHSNRFSNNTYKFRERAFRACAELLPDDFDLYGRGWDASTPCYRGMVPASYAWDWDGKVATLARYRFALCFENGFNQPGYVSEKAIDCFCARTIPVYYGASGVERYIPRECFIDLRDIGGFPRLAEVLRSMTAATYARYIEAIEAFMHSERIGFFSTEHFNRTIANAL